MQAHTRFPDGPVLGVESSCDDTAAAVLLQGRVLSSVVSSQSDHLPFDGIVPELASRAHLRLMAPVVRQALADAGVGWKDLAGIAATHAPGLIGSLLVGLTFAKTAAASLGIPFVGINHLEAHLVSVLLEERDIQPPFVGLLVSGGHSEIVLAREWHRYTILGSTRDDAAGEAFDKVAILLDLGFPGGPAIQELARTGNPDAVRFPRAWLDPGSLDFSFSGLKTAVRNFVHKAGGPGALSPGVRADVARAFEEAVVDVLVQKTTLAAGQEGISTVVLAGGVAANARLREALESACRGRGWTLATPRIEYCGDNAAMVALAGGLRLGRGETSPWSLPAIPTLMESSFGK